MVRNSVRHLIRINPIQTKIWIRFRINPDCKNNNNLYNRGYNDKY